MANAIVKTVVTLVDTSKLPKRHDDTIWEHHCIAFLYTDQVFYALNEDKVCRGLALMLLQNAVKFNLREFQEVWQQSVPEGMSTRLDQLKVSTLKKDIIGFIHACGIACLQILWKCCTFCLLAKPPALQMLQSVALVDRASHPETICLLRVEDLPEDTLERFHHLFTLREKWTEDDITPYIQ